MTRHSLTSPSSTSTGPAAPSTSAASSTSPTTGTQVDVGCLLLSILSPLVFLSYLPSSFSLLSPFFLSYLPSSFSLLSVFDSSLPSPFSLLSPRLSLFSPLVCRSVFTGWLPDSYSSILNFSEAHSSLRHSQLNNLFHVISSPLLTV